MFGLQKQRRNATSSGAWFIAGHLTVFAKLSHHAVRLESRIFSSRCFRVLRNLAPPVSPFAVPPSAALSLLRPGRFLFLASSNSTAFHHHALHLLLLEPPPERLRVPRRPGYLPTKRKNQPLCKPLCKPLCSPRSYETFVAGWARRQYSDLRELNKRLCFLFLCSCLVSRERTTSRFISAVKNETRETLGNCSARTLKLFIGSGHSYVCREYFRAFQKTDAKDSASMPPLMKNS